MYTNRESWRSSVNFSTEVYDNYLLWSPTMFIAPQSHIYDRFLYDPILSTWTVDKFLDDLEVRYGGIDGVLLWGTYPNMGIDERSQFDLYEDVPGGLVALKSVVAQFNKRGVHVGLPYNPWDTGTARREVDDPTSLAQLAAAVGAEFVNGDTMALMPNAFFNASVIAGTPLALEPEGGATLDTISWTKMGWGYWVTGEAVSVPVVDTWKWVEHRHISHICNRWGTMNTQTPSHILDLQHAFFNGDGFVSWESVWGTWNGMSERDCEATRRVASILRFLAPFFSAGPEANSKTWTPHTLVTASAYAAGAYSSRWDLPSGGGYYAHDATAYTIVSTGAADFSGPILPVPCNDPSVVYFDLYAGVLILPVPAPEGGCALPLYLEANGYGAVLALAAVDASPVPSSLLDFLTQMAAMTARQLASYDTAPLLLQQTMTLITPAPLATAPAGTVLIAGQSEYRFSVSGTEIEGRIVNGNDVQFAWESSAETNHPPHRINIPNLFVDSTPVTNSQYATFLATTNYAPTDTYNFLRDWNGARTPPQGWEQKPVTWVDLIDARAYCAASGKRLPNDWEWQYFAEWNTFTTLSLGYGLECESCAPTDQWYGASTATRCRHHTLR